MDPVVAILGRPNVGKSTLFNRLVGARAALVGSEPGVTRDRREGEASLGGLAFTVVDTAGFEDSPGGVIAAGMQEQTMRAARGADVVLLVVDARAGITPLDELFARQIRRGGAPAVLVANKCESRASEAGILESSRLGMGDAVVVAAEHGIGMADLELALRGVFGRLGGAAGCGAEDDGAAAGQAPLRLIIAGRPNVGKSTLMNRLLDEERVITSPEPGTTRDAVAARWTWDGRPFELVDTAGLRRRGRISETVERLSVGDTLEAIRLSHVVVLVLDANQMPERQDLAIANRVADDGRAMVLAVNKWDIVKDRRAALRRLRDRLRTSLPQVRGIPAVTLSARTGDGVERLLPEVVSAHGVWRRRVATALLNRWIGDVVAHHPPPLHKGSAVRIRYLTQSGTGPPSFTLFVNRPQGVPESYRRYLVNEIRETFDFPGVPIRINLRRQGNPYAPGR